MIDFKFTYEEDGTLFEVRVKQVELGAIKTPSFMIIKNIKYVGRITLQDGIYRRIDDATLTDEEIDRISEEIDKFKAIK